MPEFDRRRKVFSAVVVLMGAAVVILTAWIAVAGPVTVLRILRYGDTNIDDYSHYPGRELSPSPSPFRLATADEEMAIPRDALSELGFEQDLGSVLKANDTIAFIVLQDDTVRYERYFQDHTPSSVSQLFSVTKSITSALIGLAIHDGMIEGVGQPIIDFVPELEEGFDQVTVHHLLTMMSGSSYQENDNPFGEHVILNFTPELEKRILRTDLQDEPGTVFRYKSGDNALLGLALARALGPETITAYAQRRLWSPLGMQDRGMWTIDHEGDGLEKTWCCLAMSARDLARFGRLYLEHGAFGGERILSADWVERSTQRGHIPAAVWPQDFRSIGWRNYGYQWWLASEEDGDYFGLGKDGQFVYVNPSTHTVIVRLGWSSGDLRSSQWVSMFQSIARLNR